ncbi:MAG: tRNA (adenosine(37)-N6)-threonylcarbamoyltransferase complex ATPase subunit type 1 TsaE, partial [Phycisphaeraceae bacterium]|nr:tRNA (adenosine(37)-N6)-threonylcarbamoyltransferase complex ATPase subunit type 1 TsaE [Phycisphaeraceae bacterium]
MTPSDPWRLTLGSLDDTRRLGLAVAAACRAGDVVALEGELGAGKTQLVRGIAEGLGINGREVSSPTFVIAREHEAPGDGPVLVHIDAYRVTSSEELATIGWDAPGGGELAVGAVLAVEWAGRVASMLGEDCLQVTLEHVDEQTRAAAVVGGGSWADRVTKVKAHYEEADGGAG